MVDSLFSRYVSHELIFTARQLFDVCFQATLFYFIYRFVFRRSSSYLSAIHLWLYIGVASLVLNVPSIVIEHLITARPLSEDTLHTLQTLGEPFSTMCSQYPDGYICRLYGQLYNAALAMTIFISRHGFVEDLSGIVIYTIYVACGLIMILPVILFVWLMLIEVKILASALAMNAYVMAVVVVIVSIGTVILYSAVPEFAYLFSDSGHARAVEIQLLLKTLRAQ